MGSPDEPSTELLAAQPAVAPAIADAHEVLPPVIGRVLGGRFTVVEQLGRGGSGEVYRADQTQLGRSAVIKVLRRDLSRGGLRIERFLREAKLASRLDHPYAAHIYAFGAEPDGLMWIAMEHVRGVTLDDLVTRRGAMHAHVFTPLFTRLCEVLHTAHELGIVHRDIKGANVMVIERAGQLLPKLLDFGIAKVDAVAEETAEGAADGTDGDLTAHGVTLGSPHYMAPEQWTSPADVDARADIYALGVLAYRCLAGRLPFHTLGRHELADAHTSRPVPAMPDFVAAPFADAVLRALDKDPARRWPTAIAFGEAIQRAAGTTAAEAVPIFDPATRDAWLRAGPQPIADAVAHLTSASTTVEADAALRELVAITCRWLAVLALPGLPSMADAAVRKGARDVAGRDDGSPWLALATAAAAAAPEPLPALVGALAGADRLRALAARLDERDRARTLAALTADVADAAEALAGLESLLAYQLVVGRADGTSESWQGPRRRERERVLVWGEPLAAGEVALVDANRKVVARLSPYAQVLAPLPAAEPELFLLWRSGRGPARLVAAPWGFEHDDERAGNLLAALSTEDSDTAIDAKDERSPYPGLAAYSIADADHFVGREREVEAIANRLVRSSLVAVLGPSGVGKSSFIHAGVVARLRDRYRVVTLRPGRHPLAALQAIGETTEDTLIVIDQLEELVTLCSDPAERTRFAERLAALAGPSVRVIATLRDDFATVIESEDALRGQFDVFVLAAPSEESLRRIVIEPARRVNVAVDARVVDDMVAAVAGRPASLPLLSFTAAQLWQTRDRGARRITYAAYIALGGVAGALATYADEVYASLGRRDQETVRDLFARLVAADGTRIPSPRTELEGLPGARTVLAHLIDARLLVTRDDDGPELERPGFTPGRGESVVEIVHECLAERWPRLARWRTEDAADRALLADVRVAARRWDDAKRSGDLVWRGAAVAELKRLAERSQALTPVERAFADASLRAQQRARRVRRSLVAAVIVVLAGVAGTMAYLGRQANENRAVAERNATLAEDRLTASLIAQGRRELGDNRPLPALAYFGAAMKRGADSVGLRTMVAYASRGWRDILMTHYTPQTTSMSVSPAGWIVTGDATGMVRWWNDKGAQIGQLDPGVGTITTAEPTRDGGVIVNGPRGIAVVDDKRVITHRIPLTDAYWDVRPGPSGTLLAVTPTDFRVLGLDGHEVSRRPKAGQVQFVGDGRYALISTDDEIREVDVTTGVETVISTAAFLSPVVSADRTTWAYAERGKGIRVMSADGTLRRSIERSTRPSALVLSSDGTRIGIAGETDISIYDDKGVRQSTVDLAKDQPVFALRGDDLWTAGGDGIVRHYHDGEIVASVPVSPTEIIVMALFGDALAAAGSDTSFTIMRADARQVVYGEEACPKVAYTSYGVAIGYQCDDITKLFVGREYIGDAPTGDLTVDFHEPSHRAVIGDARGLHVTENGKPIASTVKTGVAVFADADHLFIADGKTLSRWAFATDTWERLRDLAAPDSLASVRGQPIVSTAGELDAGATKVKLGETLTALVPSPDGRWLAALDASGRTSLVDTRTWTVVRTLPTADNYGASPTFDATGELLLRTSRQALAIWDATTGDELVFGLDLLEDALNGRILPDGRLEIAQREPALVDIARDTRPAAAIVHDIDCKVPLEVVGSRIQPRTPTCQ